MANRILIVEDEPAIRALYREALQPAGYEISECDNGRDAFDRVNKEQPDLLILDVMLPGIDGYVLVKQFGKHGSTGHIPILISTALGQTSALCKESKQVAGCLAKPITPKELVAKVQEVMAARGKPS